MKSGIELITEERNEHPSKHGFNLEHDKQHEDSSLSWNAAILATPNILFCKHEFANVTTYEKAEVCEGWKLPSPNFGPNGSNVVIDNEKLPKTKRIKQLKVAGALIAAEIDRIQAK